MVMRHDPEMWDLLEDAFGDFDGPLVHVEQTVIDGDVGRWKHEEIHWKQHRDMHGDRDFDHRVATHKIREAQEGLARVLATGFDAVHLTSVETREGRREGAPLARYTLLVFRKPAVQQTPTLPSATVSR